jgi:hypothetical protein
MTRTDVAWTRVAPARSTPSTWTSEHEPSPKPIHHVLSRVFEEVEEILNKYAASEVHWIRPAEWKPHPHARLLPADLEVLKSPHEKDAAGIARYELAYQQRKEVA